MLKHSALPLALLTAASGAAAQDLEIAINDDMVEGVYSRQAYGEGKRRDHFGGGVIVNNDSDLVGSGFYRINNDLQGQLNPITVGLGGKAYAASLDHSDETVGALALSGNARVSLPTDIPLSVAGQAHLAPEILTAGESDGLTEVQLRLESQVLDGVDAFFGYRYLEFDMENAQDEEVDDGLQLGVRFYF